MHLTKQLMKNNDILQDWKPNKGFQSFSSYKEFKYPIII